MYVHTPLGSRTVSYVAGATLPVPLADLRLATALLQTPAMHGRLRRLKLVYRFSISRCWQVCE